MNRLMIMLITHSIADQVAGHLRDGIKDGKWTEYMPGRDRLAKELGVHGSTVLRALEKLEQEGLLKSQGRGKRRKIMLPKEEIHVGLRVLIVIYEPEDLSGFYIVEILHLLRAAGHIPVIAPKSLSELRHDPGRVAAMIETHPAGAYILMAAARVILEKVIEMDMPTFALFGRMSELPIAGTGYDKLPAMQETVQWLNGKGKKRIVMLMRAEHMKAKRGVIEQAFLDELEKQSLPSGAYNLPVWENSADGLYKCLGNLFKVTPPDAILVDDWALFYLVQNYLAHERGQHFREVTCVCLDYHRSFRWCRPHIAYFDWDPNQVVHRTVSWIEKVAQGNVEKTQRLVKARLVTDKT